MLFESSNTDMENFVKYPKYLFVSMGLWPIIKPNWLREAHRIFSHIISYVFTLSLVINLYFSLNDLATAADAVYLCSTNVTYLIKVTLFSKKKKQFEELLKSLENDLFIAHNALEKEFAKKWIEKAYFYCKFFTFSVVGYLCLFGLFPLFDQEAYLPAQGWFPFDVKNNKLNYTSAYLFQMFGLAVCATINVSLDLMPSVIMNIGCAQLEILKHNLKHAMEDAKIKAGAEENNEEMVTEETEEILASTLVKCVKHHEAISNIFIKIQNIFNPGMLVQFLSCALTLCMTGLQLIVLPVASLKFLSVVVYFMIMIVEVALYCFNGHHVLVESSTISDSCYEMNWYQCSTRIKKILIIIMERCKRPNIVTAGVFDLSIVTLTFLLRTSYSYFTVLNRMYNK